MKVIKLLWLIPMLILVYIFNIIHVILSIPKILILGYQFYCRNSAYGDMNDMGSGAVKQYLLDLGIDIINIDIQIMYDNHILSIDVTQDKIILIYLPTLMGHTDKEIISIINYGLKQLNQIEKEDLILDNVNKSITWKGVTKTKDEWFGNIKDGTILGMTKGLSLDKLLPWGAEVYGVNNTFDKINVVLTSYITIVVLYGTSCLKHQIKDCFK